MHPQDKLSLRTKPSEMSYQNVYCKLYLCKIGFTFRSCDTVYIFIIDVSGVVIYIYL